MELLKSTLADGINSGYQIFSNLTNIDSYQYHCIDLHTNSLKGETLPPTEDNKYPLTAQIMDTFFSEFDRKDPDINQKVCLYIFEYPKIETNYIIGLIRAYRKKNERNVSALKDKPNLGGNILYVGKVKKDLRGRLCTHFGFANEKIGGMQLRHWIDKNILLKVHIFTFNKDVDDFVNPLELYLSKKLNPLIGKSK